jgi:L-ascorbate metabolism protein UlaG (beta-lactamase superfamily)
VETGVFSGIAPDEYVVLTPLSDLYTLYADNKPHFEVPEVRISLFCKGSYTARVRAISSALMDNGFMITDRRYIGHDGDTGYFHYILDVAKEYPCGGMGGN